jgi:hypothetical protein
MIRLFIKDSTVLNNMCENILNNKKAGIYDGAYKVVEHAMNLKRIGG